MHKPHQSDGTATAWCAMRVSQGLSCGDVVMCSTGAVAHTLVYRLH